MPEASVRDAFLDGIELIYDELYSDKLEYFPIDWVKTPVNVYLESPEKAFKPSIMFVGKINISAPTNDNTVVKSKIEAKIEIPTKQLIRNAIPYSTEEDISALCGGKFVFGGYTYLIDRVEPSLLIAGSFLKFCFFCTAEKKSSLD